MLLVTLLSGCFFFREELPDDSCESDRDCFVAQGESCDVDTGACVVAEGPDAGAGVLSDDVADDVAAAVADEPGTPEVQP